MPFPWLAVASLGAKGLSSLFGSKSGNQYDNNREALIAQLGLRQQMSEDQRLARLKLALSILRQVPKTTQNGAVQTHALIPDEATLAQLMQERKYDFGSAVPERAGGGFNGFLSGLFGGAANIIPRLGGGASDAGGGIASLAAGPGNPLAPNGGQITGGPGTPAPGPNITLEQLLQMFPDAEKKPEDYGAM